MTQVDSRAQQLSRALVERGDYREARVLDDGSVAALGDLLYTTAIYTGCDEAGWSRRYCYDDANLAMAEFRALKDAQTQPRGWIATRP